MNYCLFDSELGTGGIAWGPSGITGVTLPASDAPRVRASMRRRHPRATESEPNPAVAEVIKRIQAILSGESSDDLRDITLDETSVPPFDREVYAVARTLKPGDTISYGEIASRLGDVHRAREVGQAMAHNPFPIIVPCHRVLAANGKLGGFSAPGGVATKQRLLEIERASVSWQLPLV
jgi:methylated-DNA-[protein]-cysteine S-methyltransferase